MDDDWDLYAVVRGCAGATTNTNPCGSVFSTLHQDYDLCSGWFQDLFGSTRRESIVDELHDFCKPFCPNSQQSSQKLLSPQSLPISPLSVLGGLQDLSYEQQPQLQKMNGITHQTQFTPKQQSFSVVNSSKASRNPISRSKRRKNHMKKVCHVPAENLSSDMWSWRKYGQKPIKGSPYPRGYYRCSTSKGCMARKQVERNRCDPGMFIVTYTAEHNHPMPAHRNALAGSTRQKPVETPNSEDANKPSCLPEMSQETEKLESSRDDFVVEPEDEDDDFSVSNMALDEDFFAGLEDLTGPNAGEFFADHIPTRPPFPWLVNSANTTTAGGS